MMFYDNERLLQHFQLVVSLGKAKDFDRLRAFVRQHPEVIQESSSAGSLIHFAALLGETEYLSELVKCGVCINTPHIPSTPDNRPLEAAVSSAKTETVRWMLEHGSDVNWQSRWPEKPPYCEALSTAVRDGNLEIVRMLVEAGARLDVLDGRDLTPLSWAIAYGQHQIADYLRSKGAVEAHAAPGYTPPPPPDPVLTYAQNRVGHAEPLPWLLPAPVAVRRHWDGSRCWLVTHGMSARPMAVPPGGEAFRRAELAMRLGGDWETDELADYQRPELHWPVEWLIQLAAYPFENGIWLGKYCVVANEEPPEPLSPHTAMTCWLLLQEKPPLERVELPGGDSVVFYTAHPIHTAERDYMKEYGWVALLERFHEAVVPDFLDPGRPSAV